jgi:hypothetical protein
VYITGALWVNIGGALWVNTHGYYKAVIDTRASLWIWAVLVCIWHVVVCVGRRTRADSRERRVEGSAADIATEIVIDLEPLLVEMREVGAGVEVDKARREALEAQFECIREACFKHRVSQILMERVDRGVKPVLSLIYLFHRYANCQGRLAGFLSRNAYAAYLIHEVAIIAIAYAAQGIVLYPLLKWGLVSLVAVPLCFGLSGLIRRLPHTDRVL